MFKFTTQKQRVMGHAIRKTYMPTYCDQFKLIQNVLNTKAKHFDNALFKNNTQMYKIKDYLFLIRDTKLDAETKEIAIIYC